MNLIDIKKGLPGIAPAIGAYFYAAIVVTMHRLNHAEHLTMPLNGDNPKILDINWQDTFNDQLDRSFKEDSSMIDAAASGFSCLLAIEETNYTIVERGYKGSGFDYYLGYDNEPLFTKAARLEISGIKQENEGNTIEKRLRIKLKQTDQSDQEKLPAYVSIIEFSKPKAVFKKK